MSNYSSNRYPMGDGPNPSGSPEIVTQPPTGEDSEGRDRAGTGEQPPADRVNEIPAGGDGAISAGTEDAIHTAHRRPRAVSARAVFLGLVGGAALCAITPSNDFKVFSTYIAGTQFPMGAIWVETLLVAVNILLWRRWPAAAFTRGELLTVWVLVAVPSGLPSSGMMRYFFGHLLVPHYYSDEINRWEELVWGETPRWLRITDAAAVRHFYEGYPRGQERIPWEAWAGPLFYWGILVVLFFAASFCIASLLRREWVRNEHFAFPLVVLPALLADEPEPGRCVNALIRSPYLWVAFGIVTVIHTVRGLHVLYPSVPDIPVEWNLAASFTTPPWNRIGWFTAYLFFLVIGIAFLLPADVCFSLWFFFFFYKAEMLLAAAYEWEMGGSLSAISRTQFHSLQAFGGALALVGWTFWSARDHLRSVWVKALGGPGAAAIDDSGEMLSYRATVAGLLVSYGGIALWMHMARVTPDLIVVTLAMMTIALVTISWLVCQAGMLFTQMPYITLDIAVPTLGSAAFRPISLYTIYRFEGSFIYDTRELLLPSVLMGAKAADHGRFSARALFRAMVAALVLGLAVSTVASLALPYMNGGANLLPIAQWGYRWAATIPLQFLAGAASSPHEGSWGNVLHILGGGGGVLGILFLRARTGLGLHPAGFIGASVHALHCLWFSILIGWVVKSLVQRYGGLRGYRALLPFFLGLIVGDVLNAGVWIVLCRITGSSYNLMPT